MSWNSTNESSQSGHHHHEHHHGQHHGQHDGQECDRGNYDQYDHHHDHHHDHEHDYQNKSTLTKVGDKIKGVFGKGTEDENRNEDMNTSAYTPGSNEASESHPDYSVRHPDSQTFSGGNNISTSSGRDPEPPTIGSRTQPQNTFGSGGDFGPGKQSKTTRTQYQSAEGVNEDFQNPVTFGSSEDSFSGKGNEDYDPSEIKIPISNDTFGSPGGIKHDYDYPRKGFGTTGGGGDSYGPGIIE